uniref:Kinetochore protein NDC80 n=1 Tax=Strongyloides papillosus TaxID=174720 RepID=A0A0N5BMQ4_STREA
MSNNQSAFGRSISEKPSFSGKQSLTGRPSMVGRLSMGRPSTGRPSTGRPSLGRPSLARQSLAGHSRNVAGPQMRRKTGLSHKEVEEYSRVLREFISEYNVFDAEAAVVTKDFNYATEMNFLDYLQIIVYHIAEDYQCTKLEKDLNFWLSALGMDTLQTTMFTSLRNNWKYVVEGLVKLVRVVQNRDEVERFKESGGNDDDGSAFEIWNDGNFLELFFTTIENMNGSNRCGPEHYQEGLKNYMDGYMSYTLDVNDDVETLRERVEFLRRKKNDLDEIRAEIEKEKTSVEKMRVDSTNLEKYSTELNENLTKIQDLVVQHDEICKKKEQEVEEAHKKWMEAISNVTNQRFSKDEAREYSARNSLIAGHIQSIEQQSKILEEEYSRKLAETSGLLKAVGTASSKLISRVQGLDARIGGESLFQDRNIKAIDVFGDINALSEHYDTYIYSVVEELIRKIDLICTKKKEEANGAEGNLAETITACQKLLGDCSKFEIRNQDLEEAIKADIQRMSQERESEINKKERMVKEIEWVENFSSGDKNFALEELKNELNEYKERSQKFIERRKEKLTEKINEDVKYTEKIKVMKDEISKVLGENRRVIGEINGINSEWPRYVKE